MKSLRLPSLLDIQGGQQIVDDLVALAHGAVNCSVCIRKIFRKRAFVQEVSAGVSVIAHLETRLKGSVAQFMRYAPHGVAEITGFHHGIEHRIEVQYGLRHSLNGKYVNI